MKCPRCGTENPGGRSVCVRCGARLRGATAQLAGPAPGSPEAEARQMGWLRRDLGRLALVTVLVVGAALALGIYLR